ncbi:hypothetical protein JB92DRAFT_3111824 [Gautieria morchelliformis]|nr:hypothetical protein JB92DRAFT_3111824 [Gautieria morchelliformis]
MPPAEDADPVPDTPFPLPLHPLRPRLGWHIRPVERQAQRPREWGPMGAPRDLDIEPHGGQLQQAGDRRPARTQQHHTCSAKILMITGCVGFQGMEEQPQPQPEDDDKLDNTVERELPGVAALSTELSPASHSVLPSTYAHALAMGAAASHHAQPSLTLESDTSSERCVSQLHIPTHARASSHPGFNMALWDYEQDAVEGDGLWSIDEAMLSEENRHRNRFPTDSDTSSVFLRVPSPHRTPHGAQARRLTGPTTPLFTALRCLLVCGRSCGMLDAAAA